MGTSPQRRYQNAQGRMTIRTPSEEFQKGWGLSPRFTIARWTTIFVVLGVVARLVRYAVNFPLSADEFMLAANLLDRNPMELLEPLDHNQVAPVGFLWLEWGVVRIFGFSEYSLRLPAIVCAVFSVFLFRHVAGRLLRGTALVFAVAIFSVAYYPIRYAAEIKPYGTDAFVALALFALAVEWWRSPGQVRWLWLLAVSAPVGLALSFPAAFISGGISLGIAWALFRKRPMPVARPAAAWLAFNATVLAAFVGLQQLSFSAQYEAARKIMTDCWADNFPPWHRPLDLGVWLIQVHTSEMFAYPLGAEHGGSTLTSIGFVAGLWAMTRRARSGPAVAIGGCFFLSLIAAALHRYPYGGHARLSQYVAPVICLMVGLGGAQLIGRLRRAQWQVAGVRVTMALCAAIGAFMPLRDFTKPWQSAIERDHRDFARRLWAQAGGDSPIYCLHADLGVNVYASNFEPGYLCYRRIYATPGRSRPGRPILLEEIADRPFRCVSFHTGAAPRNEAALVGWMNTMSSRFDLVEVKSCEIRDQVPAWYDIYSFCPKSSPAGQSAIRMAGERPHPSR